MALPMSLAGGGARPRPGRRTASCHTVKVRGRVLNRPRSIPVGVAFDGTNIWATNARLGQRVEDRAVLSDHSPRRQHRTTAQLKRPETATRQGTAPGQRSPTENTAWTVPDRRIEGAHFTQSAAAKRARIPGGAGRYRCDPPGPVGGYEERDAPATKAATM